MIMKLQSNTLPDEIELSILTSGSFSLLYLQKKKGLIKPVIFISDYFISDSWSAEEHSLDSNVVARPKSRVICTDINSH